MRPAGIVPRARQRQRARRDYSHLRDCLRDGRHTRTPHARRHAHEHTAHNGKSCPPAPPLYPRAVRPVPTLQSSRASRGQSRGQSRVTKTATRAVAHHEGSHAGSRAPGATRRVEGTRPPRRGTANAARRGRRGATGAARHPPAAPAWRGLESGLLTPKRPFAGPSAAHTAGSRLGRESSP